MTWVLKRNCSASPIQLATIFGSLVAVSFGFGVGFAALGLWMVLPFVGLELVAVAAAFVWIARHATDVERIELDGERLIVDCVHGTQRRRWDFDARRVRVRLAERGEGDGAPVRVELTERDRRVEIGRHLVGPGRMRLARELRGALAMVQVRSHGAAVRTPRNTAAMDNGVQ